MGAAPCVLPLSHPSASSPSVAGSKAANLARAAAAGLPTVPGFVLTVEGVARGLGDAAVLGDLRAAWTELGGAADVPLVVRSSSTIEDVGSSSMAGRFTSVLDVVGWDGFVEAVGRVIASAHAVLSTTGTAMPMAVLVQRQVDAGTGGVLFGVDPVTGDPDHLVVEIVASRPDALVGGEVTADHYVLSLRGNVVQRTRTGTADRLTSELRRGLADVAARAAEVFGAPQDVEWAVDRDGVLWLLQSRPVTAVAAAGPRHSSPLLGPGPVAETFPFPLSRLEADLWIRPLREGIVRALQTTGAASEHAIDRSPVVTTVGGWAAADLDLLGITSSQPGLWQRISPAAIGRHLARAWRVGRLRVALPQLAASVIATVDRDLSSVPRLEELEDAPLADLLALARRELATVHTYEVLSGMLLRVGEGSVPAPLIALRALAAGRATGRADDEIVRAEPVVLALVPPSLSAPLALPEALPAPASPAATVDGLDPRDALRLRARWLQELTVRIVRELADRLLRDGVIADRVLVLELDVDELAIVVDGGPLPSDLAARADRRAGPPLPPVFRLDTAGVVRAARHGRQSRAAGMPAGGGRTVGEARHRIVPGESTPGLILVTRHLEPQLAPLLPSLAGLVAETGSALSHLAILARESGVPTVVGVDGALHRFPPGSHLLIDGSTGEVEVLDGDHEAVPA